MSAYEWDFKAIYADTLQEYSHKADQKLPQVDSPKFSIKDVGDGNLNHVLIVSDGDSTIIMKHAPPFIKCIGPEYPLEEARLDIEYSSLALCHAKCPGSTPLPLYYSPTQHTVLMEYLSGYEVMKTQLIGGTVDREAIVQVTRNLAHIQIATHKNTLSKEEFSKLKESFRNESMCGLTEQFIFTRPFERDDPTNLVKARVVEEAERRVYTNTPLLDAVAILRGSFLWEAECFVHGDLHTGSVMVRGGEAKIMDNEFSYVGPMAFDLGLFVAHLVISYHQHSVASPDPSVQPRVTSDLKAATVDTLKIYTSELSSKLPGFTPEFEAHFLSQVAGFAGCELMRRVLGVAHVPDINDSEEMELQVLKRGIALVERQADVTSIQTFISIALE